MAQRMGVMEFHSADLQNSRDVLSALNEFGVHTSMFVERPSRPEEMKRALLYVEGDKNKECMLAIAIELIQASGANNM